mgnify:CR=1 FL=1
MDGIDRLFGGLHVSASALKAERTRIDVIAQNIANAQTTRMPGTDEPYRRQVGHFAPILERARNGGFGPSGVRVSKVVGDQATPFESVHDPSHPHANAQGIVNFPNVNVTREMADLMTAVRSYEASLSVQESFLQMVERSLRLAE